MSTSSLASPDKKRIQGFFDAIAGRYDFLNELLSFKLDDYWRSRAVKLSLRGTERSILDIGLGTGKFLEIYLKQQSWERVCALDFSRNMLSSARSQMKERAQFICADFHDLPLASQSFDIIISSFTLRSVKSMKQFLTENYRLLNSEGRVVYLCLTRPTNPLMKLLYYPYLHFYLPLIGRLFSGHREAYQFLAQSIQNFQSPTITMDAMHSVGFKNVCAKPLSFGLATLIMGDR